MPKFAANLSMMFQGLGFLDRFDRAYPHVQNAGNPGRHAPDVSEINYLYLLDLSDEIGYQGWIGCEYRPEGDTSPASAGPKNTASAKPKQSAGILPACRP